MKALFAAYSKVKKASLTLKLLESRRDEFAFDDGKKLQVPSNKKVSLQRTMQNSFTKLKKKKSRRVRYAYAKPTEVQQRTIVKWFLNDREPDKDNLPWPLTKYLFQEEILVRQHVFKPCFFD